MTAVESLTLGRILARQGDAERAERVLAEAADDPATAVEALEALGDLYRANGLDDEAALCFERAIALEPQATFYVRLAECRLATGAHAEAEAAAQRALRSAGRPLVAYVLLGRALEGLGRPTDAIAAYETAIARERDWAAARYYLASLLVAQGEHARAASHLQVLATVAPDHAPGFVLAAESALARGDDRQAVVELARAAALGPLQAAEYRALGGAAGRLGDAATALAAYEAAQRVDPADAEAALEAAGTAETAGWASLARGYWQALTYVARHRDAATAALTRLEGAADAPGAPAWPGGTIDFAGPAAPERPTGPLAKPAPAMPDTQPLAKPGALPGLRPGTGPGLARALPAAGSSPLAAPRGADALSLSPTVRAGSAPLPGGRSGPLPGASGAATSTSQLRMGAFKPPPPPGAKPPAPRPPAPEAE